MIRNILLLLLGLVSIAFLAFFLRRAISALGSISVKAEGVTLGAITNFFDTLGIGSFAPTLAWLRIRRLTEDVEIPATINVGHALPVLGQALIFINIIEVDPRLLLACILSAIMGAAFGAPIVIKLPARPIRIGVGLALLIASAFFVAAGLGAMPDSYSGSESLDAFGFTIAVFAFFVFAALQTIGIGMYAPSVVLFSLLGLDPKSAFPVMMGAAAFVMPVCSFWFLRSTRLNVKVALGLTIGGIPAVLAAAYFVKSLPIDVMRWVVVVIASYAGISALVDGIRTKNHASDLTKA